MPVRFLQSLLAVADQAEQEKVITERTHRCPRLLQAPRHLIQLHLLAVVVVDILAAVKTVVLAVVEVVAPLRQQVQAEQEIHHQQPQAKEIMAALLAEPVVVLVAAVVEQVRQVQMPLIQGRT